MIAWLMQMIFLMLWHGIALWLISQRVLLMLIKLTAIRLISLNRGAVKSYKITTVMTVSGDAC
ncbi:MAG: hypothetical protein Q8Q81_17405 [Oxalobacteraceae bacterium]|nr:hypothetical protein [Oxalobacteraceae bacterium]